MTRFRIVTLTSSVALAAGLSLVLATTAGAAPGDFFPGGDLGIVPPDSPKGPITKQIVECVGEVPHRPRHREARRNGRGKL